MFTLIVVWVHRPSITQCSPLLIPPYSPLTFSFSFSSSYIQLHTARGTLYLLLSKVYSKQDLFIQSSHSSLLFFFFLLFYFPTCQHIHKWQHQQQKHLQTIVKIMMMDDDVESTQQQQTCCKACHQPCSSTIDPIRIRGEIYHPTCLVCEVSTYLFSFQ